MRRAHPGIGVADVAVIGQEKGIEAEPADPQVEVVAGTPAQKGPIQILLEEVPRVIARHPLHGPVPGLVEIDADLDAQARIWGKAPTPRHPPALAGVAAEADAVAVGSGQNRGTKAFEGDLGPSVARRRRNGGYADQEPRCRKLDMPLHGNREPVRIDSLGAVRE